MVPRKILPSLLKLHNAWEPVIHVAYDHRMTCWISFMLLERQNDTDTPQSCWRGDVTVLKTVAMPTTAESEGVRTLAD